MQEKGVLGMIRKWVRKEKKERKAWEDDREKNT